MVKKIVLTLLLVLVLAPAASFAQVSIRIGPPPPVYERHGRPPERGYVWIGGYQRRDGDHYTWNPGRWERPPHEHDRWQPHHWQRRHGEWVMVEGHWR